MITTFKFASAALCFAGFLVASIVAMAEIPVPTDAPKPFSPAESGQKFHVPEGFRLELIAAEPLIRQPTGVCWDARGRLFVCELHGYNMDGQLDIEELNKTGKLDREVRRIRASEAIEQAAKKFMYGTVKVLHDSDGDGVMDKADVWADHLPPCYGVCPSRDGVIVTCAPDIVFLADRDGDGTAEVREVLYTGFDTGPLERGINCPQWGLDDWIYVGCGHDGGLITGPHLKEPVKLSHTDFRIKADGTAVEPILGATRSFGFTLNDRGDRFVATTGYPGIFIAPLPWKYLARNPDLFPDALDEPVGSRHVYPASKPHPWRTRRAEDPGFGSYYAKKYGAGESAPNGYFTSGCSPLAYQSNTLPGLNGQLLTCEPAQNLIHRAIITRDGPRVAAKRAPRERRSEFLTSTDQWFNPIYLAHAPDGTIAIADYYREIIEDYSAVPRYLQQEYGLKNGNDHGRIWRLTHRDAAKSPAADMSSLTQDELVDELSSSNFWRRQTARRLITEAHLTNVAPNIVALITSVNSSIAQDEDAKKGNSVITASTLNAMYTLEALGKITPTILLSALDSADPAVRVHALRLSEAWLDSSAPLRAKVLAMADDIDDSVALQVALTLGEIHDLTAIDKLADLARQRGNIRWIDTAIVSSLNGRAGAMLELLLDGKQDIGKAQSLVAPLSAAVGARRDNEELSQILTRLISIHDSELQFAALRGLSQCKARAADIVLSPEACEAIKHLATAKDQKIRDLAVDLVRRLGLESPAERGRRIANALNALADIQRPLDDRLAAIRTIEDDNSLEVARGLVAKVADSTPQVRTALLNAIFSRKDRIAVMLDALEAQAFSASLLTAIQRSALLEHPDVKLRERAKVLITSPSKVNADMLASYTAALAQPRDLERGREVFRKHCSMCHQAHGIGTDVGPNLTSEKMRAEETILQDILSPSSAIAAGYGTYIVNTSDGQIITGLLAAESASSITLKQQEGKTHTILRKDIEFIKANPVSLMPENLAETLTPLDVAHLLAWLK